MAKQTIFVAGDNRKAIEFICAYFSDTQSIPGMIRAKHDFPIVLDNPSHIVFLQCDWIDKAIVAHVNRIKTRSPNKKVFILGHPNFPDLKYDGEIDLPIDEKVFRKIVLSKMNYPETINLLVVDDEIEIGETIQDYFETRAHPGFKVRVAHNGLEGFKLIEQARPDCLILDIKMPVRSGIDLFHDVCKSGQKIPTIMFIDSSAADEIMEIRKWGSPTFVEKGGHYSSMPDMLALVKKLVAFS